MPRRPRTLRPLMPLTAWAAAGAFVAATGAWAQATPEAAAPAAAASGVQANTSGAAVDPITEAAARLLDQSGMIARQAELSQSLLLIERQIRQAELIKTLLATLGPDAPVEIAPGVFRTFNDTPDALRQRIELGQLERELAALQAEIDASPEKLRREIERIRLERELAEATGEAAATSPETLRREIEREQLERELAALRDSDPDSPEALRRRIEVARLRQELARVEAGEDAGSVPGGMVEGGRSDGSEAQSAPQTAAGLPAATEAAAAAPVPISPPPSPVPIRLIEVAGSGGTFWAVVAFGAEIERVYAGDVLSDGTQILEIGPAFVRLIRTGLEERLAIPG